MGLTDKLPILDGLSSLVDKLFQWASLIRAAKRENRDRIAEFCERMADCLTQGSTSLQAGVTPHGLCSQMNTHMYDLRQVLEKSLPADRFADLADALSVAYRVEYLDKELLPGDTPNDQYRAVDTAAGKFRGLAVALRATNQLSDS